MTNVKDFKSIFSKLGDIFIQKGLITEYQLQSALDRQKETGSRLGETLIKMGFVTSDAFYEVLAEQMGIDIFRVDEEKFEIDIELVELVSEETIKKRNFFPISRIGNKLTVAMIDPTDISVVDYLKISTGFTIDIKLISKADYEMLLFKFLSDDRRKNQELKKIMEDVSTDDLFLDKKKDADEDLNIDEIKAAVRDTPIVKLVNYTLYNAIQDRASDIHVEPGEKSLNIRYRIDGILFQVAILPSDVKMAFTSRLKILSGLDIAERRLPQDGGFNIVSRDGDEVDIRLSTLPTVYGEKVVMRLLRKDKKSIDLRLLGYDKDDLAILDKYARLPNGIVLITGPTGSGKSTTLYALLNEINTEKLNIVTVEDPVEYKLPGIYQVPANQKIGLTFAVGLRSILRQDPDVIMVGEIRDLETAEMAIKASLTGHLVFSTLHTINAPSAVVRLVNMGIEPFLIASSLRMVVAQRLLRVICPACKVKYVPEPALLRRLKIDPSQNATFYQGAGCEKCKESGYFGRKSILEILQVNKEISDLIVNSGSTEQINIAAIDNNMKTLIQKGLQLAIKGDTTLEEVIRVCFDSG